MHGAVQTALVRSRCISLIIALGHAAWVSGPASAKEMSVALYGGWLTANDWQEVVLPTRLEFLDSYLAALAISRQVGQLSNETRIELEGQVVRHFGIQDHWEFNALPVVRWTAFPWDEHLDTSAAAGLGLSYATRRPVAEVQIDGDSERLLAYWMLELEATLPTTESWHVLGRLHHRSAAYGLFGDKGGANVLSLGLRYRF